MKTMTRQVLMTTVLLVLALGSLDSPAQQASNAPLHGFVRDQNGGAIPGSVVTAECGHGTTRHTAARSDGAFTLLLPVGSRCRVQASAPNFATSVEAERTTPSVDPLIFVLRIAATTTDVFVNADEEPLISADPDANGGAIVLRSQDIDALPDDPDDLMEDLLALAGPSASGGVQIYTDGFTGQKLPPKSAIREIKINQNPYSAQYDHIGLGRIEILTKPGTNATHGSGEYRISDAIFDSRNPFAAGRAPYRSQLVNATIGGPLTQRLSYFFDGQAREATNNAVVNARTLDTLLRPVSLRETLLVPAHDLSLGGRIDLQSPRSTTLTGRFEFTRDLTDRAGIGGFSLATSAYASLSQSLNLQGAATTVLGTSTVNELRIQYLAQELTRSPTSTTPTIEVLDSFVAGGAPYGYARRQPSLYELQDYISYVHGRHTIVSGAQARILRFVDRSSMNFNGEYVFAGGDAPVLDAANIPVLGADGLPLRTTISSRERYRRTLALEAAGDSPATIRMLGGGASQLILGAGNLDSAFTQVDFGAFVEDDWKVGKRLTISGGLRWEGQNTIHQWYDLGPRLALAWMPGGKNSKTVIRLGSGIFFERFGPELYLDALRYNGITQQRYVIANPDSYPAPPSAATLAASGASQTTRSLAADLRSPYLWQSSFSVEHKLPSATTIAVTGTATLGRSLLYSTMLPGASFTGHDYRYKSGGVLNETQVAVSLRRKYQHGFAWFGEYRFTHANGNTDGAGMFPASQHDLHAEYGRTATDIRHYAVLNGTMPGVWGTMLTPYFIFRSGAPFNITTGHDNDGDSIFTDRPGIALDPTRAGLVQTRYGLLDPMPIAGERILPRNFGQGPDFAEMNLRVSRTFGWQRGEQSAVAPSAILHRRSFLYIPERPSGLHLTASVTARNLLNQYNPGLPSGNLSSPLFDESNTLSSATDPSLPSYGNNRRLQFELRLDF